MGKDLRPVLFPSITIYTITHKLQFIQSLLSLLEKTILYSK